MRYWQQRRETVTHIRKEAATFCKSVIITYNDSSSCTKLVFFSLVFLLLSLFMLPSYGDYIPFQAAKFAMLFTFHTSQERVRPGKMCIMNVTTAQEAGFLNTAQKFCHCNRGGFKARITWLERYSMVGFFFVDSRKSPEPRDFYCFIEKGACIIALNYCLK